MKIYNRTGVQESLRALLAGAIYKDGKAPDLSQVDWKELRSLADRAKLTGALLEAANQTGVEVPEEIFSALADFREMTEKTNQLNFAYTLQVLQLLNAAGIEALVFKGPIRSKSVYGSWGFRGSNDIDLLVRPDEYKLAEQVLVDNGFSLLVSDENRWWREYLGEMPFRRDDGVGPIVDLHYQVQQPGGPYPRDIEAFFSASHLETVGRMSYRTFNAPFSLLLAAICFGKASRNNEIWTHYAHELATVLSGLDEAEILEVEEIAREQGLWRLYCDARDTSLKLFGTDVPEDDLAELHFMMMSALGEGKRGLLFRSRLLWSWLDGGFGKRLTRFIKSSLNAFRSERIRLADERSQS